MVFIGEKSSKRRVNAHIPKYISMAYYFMFLWIPGQDGARSKVTGNFLVNILYAFHRFNRRYHVNKESLIRGRSKLFKGCSVIESGSKQIVCQQYRCYHLIGKV